MRQRPYLQVDVFTPEPYRGNPLAVVLDGEGLTAEAMQQFTDWTHLSEATFVLPPTPEGRAAGADYRVRIFSPGRELPFAGHPTLGSCHAWLQSGGQPLVAGRVVQECGVGLVALRQDDDRLAFAAPPLIKSGPLDEADVARIAQGLGVARSDILHHAWCDNGPHWRGVMLRSSEQVLALKPDASLLGQLDVGVVGAGTGLCGGHDVLPTPRTRRPRTRCRDGSAESGDQGVRNQHRSHRNNRPQRQNSDRQRRVLTDYRLHRHRSTGAKSTFLVIRAA